MGNFAGGIQLTPEGTSFLTPVTVTIPLNNTITGGDTVKLFYYDESGPANTNYPDNYPGWQQTDITATVGAVTNRKADPSVFGIVSQSNVSVTSLNANWTATITSSPSSINVEVRVSVFGDNTMSITLHPPYETPFFTFDWCNNSGTCSDPGGRSFLDLFMGVDSNLYLTPGSQSGTEEWGTYTITLQEQAR